MKRLLVLLALSACRKPTEPCVPSEKITVDTINHTWTMEGTMCEGQPLPPSLR